MTHFQRLENIREWLTNQLRPWHTSCLPEELALPDDGALQFDAEKMLRDARLGASCDIKLGVFQFLGLDEARRAAGLWSPRTRLITEEVSLAFRLVEKQRQTGEIVSGHNISRLAAALESYFQSVGRPRSLAEIRRQIEDFIARHSNFDAESISPVRLPVTVNLPLLDELLDFDREVGERFVDYHGRPATLVEVGLILDKELDGHRYDRVTPLNCRTFAGTGGDGSHFSLLVEDGAITERSPVVVTAPDCYESPSVVAAESLHEFLCLGCVKGYFALGFALHGPERMREYFDPIQGLPIGEYILRDEQHKILALMRERFGLVPSSDWERVLQLQAKYSSVLRHPPGAVMQ